MYLPVALGGLGLSALVGFFALEVRAYRRSSGYGTTTSTMTWWEHGVAYALAFSSTFGLAASAFWVESSGGYMGSVIARFVLILAAPLVAMFCLAWIPLGSWYAAYLAEARQASQTPPPAIVILGLGICSVAGFIGFWAAEMNPAGGFIGFASAAAGGLAYLFLCFWYHRRRWEQS